MSDTAIKVENLSKRYRIGLKEEMHDTLAGAITDTLARPIRNLRRLCRLTTFEDGAQPDDGRPNPKSDPPIVHRHQQTTDHRRPTTTHHPSSLRRRSGQALIVRLLPAGVVQLE